MGIRFSEKQLGALLEANPAMRAHFDSIGSVGKIAKYRNEKQYEHADGTVLEYRHEERHGKVVAIYDSKKELGRWRALQIMEKAGKITCLRRQVRLMILEAFKYQGKRVNAITYRADFIYCEENGDQVVEDVKTYDLQTEKYRCTEGFALKWKLLKHRYPEYRFLLY